MKVACKSDSKAATRYFCNMSRIESETEEANGLSVQVVFVMSLSKFIFFVFKNKLDERIINKSIVRRLA